MLIACVAAAFALSAVYADVNLPTPPTVTATTWVTTRTRRGTRPTHHSQVPFYDVFQRVSSRFRTRTSFRHTRTSTRNTPPTTRTTPTGRPTKTPPVVRFKDQGAPGDVILDAVQDERHRNDRHPKTAEQLATCTHSVASYHLILSPTSVHPPVADAACEQFGWQYADTADEDWVQVHWLLANCTDSSVGVHALEDYYTGGCQFVQQGGAYLMKLSDEECDAVGDFPILCMDTPTATATATATISYTTTTTATVNAKQRATANSRRSKSMKPIDKAAVAMKRSHQQGIIINGYDVCPSTVNGYWLIYDLLHFDDAAQVCADLGLYLADIPYANVPNIVSLYDACLPWDVLFNINSYDGLAGGLCHFAYIVPWPSIWMIISDDDQQCDWYDVPVLCQESPDHSTVHSGTFTATTTTTTTTATVSSAVSTTTTTVTVP